MKARSESRRQDDVANDEHGLVRPELGTTELQFRRSFEHASSLFRRCSKLHQFGLSVYSIGLSKKDLKGNHLKKKSDKAGEEISLSNQWPRRIIPEPDELFLSLKTVSDESYHTTLATNWTASIGKE